MADQTFLDDLRTAQDRLVQTEKLASLGVLAAGLAHNINNRLTSLKTFIDLLPHRYDDPTFRNDFLKICQTDLEKIALLVHELTRYAFSDNDQLPRQPIVELILQAIGHLDDEIQKKGILMQTRFTAVPQIPLDPQPQAAPGEGLGDRRQAHRARLIEGLLRKVERRLGRIVVAEPTVRFCGEQRRSCAAFAHGGDDSGRGS